MSYNSELIAFAIFNTTFPRKCLREGFASLRKFLGKGEKNQFLSVGTFKFSSETRDFSEKNGEFPHSSSGSQKRPAENRERSGVPAQLSITKLFSFLGVPTLKPQDPRSSQGFGSQLRPYYCLQLTDLQILPIPVLGNYSFLRLGLAYFFGMPTLSL